MGVVGQLTWARLRDRPSRWLFLVVGVALALALPVFSLATGRVVAGRALSHAIEQLPVGDRTVIASYGGSADPAVQQHDDTLVRDGLVRLTSMPVVHQMLFGELADHAGGTYRLAATEGLAHSVRLTSGRLPSSCTPTRCEVVLTGATTPPSLDASLGLVVVGAGVRTDALLLPGTFDPGPAAHLLLGADPDALQRLTSLEQFPRGSGWVAALDPQRITSLGVPAYADLSRQVSDDLALSIRALVLSVPDDALLREDARASASQGRFALLGGATAVLVLGFVLVAAAGLRREHREVAGLLRRRGASSATVLEFACLGVGIAVAAGAALGAILGWAVAWALAGAQPLHPPAAALATSSLLGALPVLVLLSVAAIALTTAVLMWPSAHVGTAWHVVELLAFLSLGAAALAGARGAVGAANVGGDPLAVALPVLALVAAGLLAARLWLPGAAFVSRHLPPTAVAARLAAASGVHRPLRTVVTVGFVTAAVGTVVFAGAYRATLQAGSADTAAFDVPTDVRLTIGPDASDPVDLQSRDPLPGNAFPVLRAVAGVRTSATSGDGVQLLGVGPTALSSVSRWDRTVGASDATSVAALLAAAPTPAGIALADDATSVTIPVLSWVRSGPGGVDVTAWVSTADGRERGVALSLRGLALTGSLPAMGPGRTLTALTLRENVVDATRRLHRVGEGGTVLAALAGRVTLGRPSTSTTPGPAATTSWSAWSSRTSDVGASTGTLRIGYELTGALVVVRPGLATRAPVRVLADAETASRGSSLRLDLGGGDAVAAQLSGVLPRFPTTGPRFLVADRASLSAALDDHDPGSGAPRELWADAGGDPVTAEHLASAVTAAPFDRTVVTTQAARRTALESDAVAQGAGWLLLVAAAVALLVAAVSLVLLVTGERRDDDGQLLAHEADGVATSTLRRSLWWRAVAAAVPGLLAGTAAGLALTRAVSSLVALSAGGAAPTPPLLPAVGPAWSGLVLLVGLAVALLVCALVASRTLRAAWPGRPGQDLR